MQSESVNGSAGVEKSDTANIQSPEVYHTLAKHQRDETWNGRELIAELQAWADRFIGEFKLDIPEVVLCLDQLSRNRYGQFRYGHNGFGLKGEIAINTRYLGKRPMWEILGTLLHELVHGWQQAHGTPGKRNHHNTEFREKAEELGLNVDRRGMTNYAAWSPFKELLRRFKVEVPDDEYVSSVKRQPGESKLKKWSCGCPVNVRVAIREFRAVCLNCGQEFRPSECREKEEGSTRRPVYRLAVDAPRGER